MVSWMFGDKADCEPGVTQGLHPGRDVRVSGGHQDLQVALARFTSINSKSYCFPDGPFRNTFDTDPVGVVSFAVEWGSAHGNTIVLHKNNVKSNCVGDELSNEPVLNVSRNFDWDVLDGTLN